jgi:hypothetical protein
MRIKLESRSCFSQYWSSTLKNQDYNKRKQYKEDDACQVSGGDPSAALLPSPGGESLYSLHLPNLLLFVLPILLVAFLFYADWKWLKPQPPAQVDTAAQT